jgi:hypothetical protein
MTLPTARLALGLDQGAIAPEAGNHVPAFPHVTLSRWERNGHAASQRRFLVPVQVEFSGR